jgi:HSP20 family protein
MMMPSIFGENLFDDWMDFPFNSGFFGRGNANTANLMKTDVKETDEAYELDIDMPGVKKEDINAQLEDGYLTVTVTRNVDNDKKDENGKYIRRERYSGNMSRSFYVGDGITQEEVQAHFENGILKLIIPKKENKAVDEKKYISIEG